MLAATLFTGCGAKKIDAATDETMFKSVESVRNALSVKERLSFDGAMATIMSESLAAGFATVFTGTNSASTFDASLRAQLHGRTATQVIALAEEKQEARRRLKVANEADDRREAESQRKLEADQATKNADASRNKQEGAARAARILAEAKTDAERIKVATKASVERLTAETKLKAEQALTQADREAIVAKAQAELERIIAAAKKEMQDAEAKAQAETGRFQPGDKVAQ